MKKAHRRRGYYRHRSTTPPESDRDTALRGVLSILLLAVTGVFLIVSGSQLALEPREFLTSEGFIRAGESLPQRLAPVPVAAPGNTRGSILDPKPGWLDLLRL